MQNIVVNTRQLLPSVLTETLPKRLCEEVEKSVPVGEMVEELRLRRGRCASLTVGGRNLRLSTVFSGVEMDDLLLRFCEGSLYAHSETISQGYLTLKGGIRVGVCGRAGVSEGSVTGVSQISALSIRIPHPAPPVGEEIALLLHRFALTRGVLIYAPPAKREQT